jgi:hypothetical protein
MIVFRADDQSAGLPCAVRGEQLLPWTPSGYGLPRPRPAHGVVDLLTPPSTVAALRRGYRPVWHDSTSRDSTSHDSTMSTAR